MKDLLLAHGPQFTLVTIFGGIALAMAVESFAPWRKVPGDPLGRWLNNLALTGLDYALLLAMGPLLSLLVADLTGWRQVGVLRRLDIGPLGDFVVVLFSLELLSYWIHRAFHTLPLLWRIHAVHHCDVEMDATTTHRHHPLEPVLSALPTLPVLVALGPDPLAVLAYNLLLVAVSVFSHANLSLPPAVEGMLRRVLVTPDFHRLHHSAERRYTDSNYGTVLTLFDRLFRTVTFLPREQQRDMRLGLDDFREARDSRLDRLLLLPFSSVFSLPSPGRA